MNKEQNFSVYRIEKGKKKALLKNLDGHILRHEEYKKTFLHADPERVNLNRDLTPEKFKNMNLLNGVNLRIKEGHTIEKKIRKDAIYFHSHVLTASHEGLAELEKDEKKFTCWIEKNFEWIEKEFGGKENIVRFVLHMDEKTPHIHVVTVPIKDGALSAEKFTGEYRALSRLQDSYALAMQEFGFGRGYKNTGVKHTKTKDYYESLEKHLYGLQEGYPDYKNLKNLISNKLKNYKTMNQAETIKEAQFLTNNQVAETAAAIREYVPILDYFKGLVGKGIVQADSLRDKPAAGLYYFNRPGNQTTDRIRVNVNEKTFVDFSKKNEKGKGLYGDILFAAQEFEGAKYPQAVRAFEPLLTQEQKDFGPRLYAEAQTAKQAQQNNTTNLQNAASEGQGTAVQTNVSGIQISIDQNAVAQANSAVGAQSNKAQTNVAGIQISTNQNTAAQANLGTQTKKWAPKTEKINIVQNIRKIGDPAVLRYISSLGLEVADIEPYLQEVGVKYFHPEQKKNVDGVALGLKGKDGFILNVVSHGKKLQLSETPKKAKPIVLDVGEDSGKEAKVFADFMDFVLYKKLFPQSQYRAIVLNMGLYNSPFQAQDASAVIRDVCADAYMKTGESLKVTTYLPDQEKAQEALQAIKQSLVSIPNPIIEQDDNFYKAGGFKSLTQYCSAKTKTVKDLQEIGKTDPTALELLSKLLINTFSERDWGMARSLREQFTAKDQNLSKEKESTQDVNQGIAL